MKSHGICQALPGVAWKEGSSKAQKGGGGCLHLQANFRSTCSIGENKVVSLLPVYNYPGISGVSKMPKSNICTVITWHQSLVLSLGSCFVCCICMLLMLDPRLNTYESLLCNPSQLYWEWSCTLSLSRMQDVWFQAGDNFNQDLLTGRQFWWKIIVCLVFVDCQRHMGCSPRLCLSRLLHACSFLKILEFLLIWSH